MGLNKIHPIPQARPAAYDRQKGLPGSAHSGTFVDQPLGVKKGDRVVAHNKKGVACHGTVHWVGRNTASRQFQFLMAGLIMVGASYQ